MPKTRPDKKELAKFKILNELGHTPNAIGNVTGRDPKTVRKWLHSDVYQDPEIMQMVETIKGKELEQLTLIGGKARSILDKYLDDCLTGAKEPNPISVTAILDRTFTQRRLLEGASTQNINIHEISKRMIEIEKEFVELEQGEVEGGEIKP